MYANAVVSAFGMGIAQDYADVTVFVWLWGGISAIPLGGLLGLLAGLSANKSPRWRAPLLALLATGLAMMLVSFATGMKAELAATLKHSTAIPIACVSTFLSALVLERWTRQIVSGRLPVATARLVNSHPDTRSAPTP